MPASEVLLVQGLSISISNTEVTELAPSPEPAAAVLDCIGREIQYQGGTATEIDVTTFCSTAKEFRLGLEDSGTMSVTGHWKQGNAAHDVIRTAAADKLTRLVTVTFEDGSVFKCLAFVAQRSWTAAVDGVVTASYSFRLTGATLEIDPV
ncbi:MAG: phage tail tube protein [Fluviibacter phosphoraccumulans]